MAEVAVVLATVAMTATVAMQAMKVVAAEATEAAAGRSAIRQTVSRLMVAQREAATPHTQHSPARDVRLAARSICGLRTAVASATASLRFRLALLRADECLHGRHV